MHACTSHALHQGTIGFRGHHDVVHCAGLLMTPKAVLLTTLALSVHSLIAVQILVLASYMTPNQDLAFVVAVCCLFLNLLLHRKTLGNTHLFLCYILCPAILPDLVSIK